MSGSAAIYLGIDVGTSSVKVLSFGTQGRERVGVGYPPATSPYEHDPDMLAQTVRLSLRKLFAEGKVLPENIAGIGLSGHGPSVMFVDRDGLPQSPIVTWQDRRALSEASMLRDLRPGYNKDGTSMEAKLFWFYRHHPELFSPGMAALAPKAYVAMILTGERSVDLSTASTIDFYDRKTGLWDAGAAAIPLHVMPKVSFSWQEIGRTGTMFSRECGLPDGIPVFPGGIDAFCEAVGAGGFVDGVIVEGSGTSTCLTRSVGIDRSPSLHAVPDASILINMLSATGACYKWFGDCFPGLNLNELSRQIDPSVPVPILFLPYLAGERSPIWDEKARGLYIGMDLETKSKEMLQALFQGVAFAIRQNLELMAEGELIHSVHAVGGVNRNDAWVQIKANVCGLPFERMAEHDASAFGAAIISAYGSGAYTLDELALMTEVEKRFEPDPAVKSAYDELFQSYVSLYPKVKETFYELFHRAGARKAQASE
jgi:xylulokinase